MTQSESNAPLSHLQDHADINRLRNARDRNAGFSIGSYLQSPPMLFTRDGHNVFLGDFFRGASAFLVCSGPSLASHDLSELDRRGVLTMTVNNAAANHRSRLWCSVDDPGNFSDVIWRDPGIWKFVPLAHMEKNFTVRDANGELVSSDEKVGDMPSVLGFRRNEDFRAEQWLYEDTFNWGNHTNQVDAYGNKGSRSVMYVALRLLYFLGVRQIYLLGCDFRMELGKQNYAFQQDRSRSSVNGNNSSYRILNERLKHLLPYFERENLSVVNCTPNSGLTAFPTTTFENAIEEATARTPQVINTSGMYDRQKVERDKARSLEEPVVINSHSVAKLTVVPSRSKAEVPDATLIIPMSCTSRDGLNKAWKTWELHKPAITRWPLCLVYESNLQRDFSLPECVAGHPNLRAISTEPDNANPHSHFAAMIRCAATEVTTPWFMCLDPYAVATAQSDWINGDWFQPTLEGQAPVLIGSKWEYVKPANRYELLDSWGDGVKGIREFQRLNVSYDSQKDRIILPTLTSWCVLGNTEWARECVALAEHRPPGGLDLTFLQYCATRQGRRTLRLPLKQLGWNHSYSWSGRDELKANCACR